MSTDETLPRPDILRSLSHWCAFRAEVFDGRVRDVGHLKPVRRLGAEVPVNEIGRRQSEARAASAEASLADAT